MSTRSAGCWRAGDRHAAVATARFRNEPHVGVVLAAQGYPMPRKTVDHHLLTSRPRSHAMVFTRNAGGRDIGTAVFGC